MVSTTQESAKKGPSEATNRIRGAVTARPRSVTHDEIAARAHSLYAQSGFQHGRDVEFWLEAERQLREDLDA